MLNTIDSFKPSLGLKNAHVQTIFSSVGPLKHMISKRFDQYSTIENEVELNGGNGVRLLGYFNQATLKPSKKLAVLIHGWEGSHNSSYMKSMAMALLEQGIDVFRLNLRDHGDTHHLNKGIFNSTLIEEVITAIEDLQSIFPYQQNHLIGFSLGGNFCLRLAALAHDHKVELSSVSAFCPAIHAAQSNVVLNHSSNWLYGKYFVRKWKRSLRKKMECWPEYDLSDDLQKLKTLDEMNLAFIPKYTVFTDIDDYFDAYAISGAMLERTIAPCFLHFAKDDMIIPIEGVNDLAANPDLHITITEYGGHCGYISNWKGDNWQDQRILEIIQSF